MHLKPTLLEAIPLLNDFDQLFLIKFTADNLILFFLYCVCWRFFGRTSNNFENLLCKLWLITFAKGRSYFEMPTLSPILNFGFQSSRSGLLYRMDKKSEILTFFGIKSIDQVRVEFSVVTN